VDGDGPSTLGRVSIDVLLASLDGHVLLRSTVLDDDPVAAGRRGALELLDEQGGRRLLEYVAAEVGG
jgi:hypothetical protein